MIFIGFVPYGTYFTLGVLDFPIGWPMRALPESNFVSSLEICSYSLVTYSTIGVLLLVLGGNCLPSSICFGWVIDDVILFLEIS